MTNPAVDDEADTADTDDSSDGNSSAGEDDSDSEQVAENDPDQGDQQTAQTPSPDEDEGEELADNGAQAAAPGDNVVDGATVAPQTSAPLTPISSQDLKDDHTKTAQDLANGHITPETYRSLFAKKDTLSKIGTIFGLLVSGAGSGLTHQPNALLEMMNKQISNDLDAQKNSASNAQNLLRINQQNEKNKADIVLAQSGVKLNEQQTRLAQADAATKAYALARMQSNQIALHDLVQQTNKLPEGSPQRQQNEQQLALLSNQVQGENFSVADRAAAASALAHVGFGSGNPQGGNQVAGDPETNFQNQQATLRLSGNAALANDRESRHMPGIPGMASVPLSGDDRDRIQSSQALVGSLNRLKQFSMANPHPLPGSSADRQGKALAAQVQGDFRVATHGGVYKEGEQNFINQVVPGDPTTWNPTAHVQDKINTVINETAARNLNFLKSKGFLSGGQNAVAQQGANPQQPNQGTATKAMYGAAYQKVAGGWQKVGTNGSPQEQVTTANPSRAGTD